MAYYGWKNGFLGDPFCLVYLWNYGHFFEVVFDFKRAIYRLVKSLLQNKWIINNYVEYNHIEARSNSNNLCVLRLYLILIDESYLGLPLIFCPLQSSRKNQK